MSAKLLLVGLDGADWKILDPLLEAGELPATAALIKRGRRACLMSTRPPVTFPAWASCFTGLPPEEHGVLDFTRFDRASRAMHFVTGRPPLGSSLPERAAGAGLKVATLGFPGTYPPPELPGGFVISGFDAPLAQRASLAGVWPRDKGKRLFQRLGPWPFAEIDELVVGPGWHAQALEALLGGLRRKQAIALEILKEAPWDLFAVHLGETDTVGHHFMAFHDPASRRCPRGASELERGAVAAVYRAADRVLAQLVEAAGIGASVIVVSDHGMCSASDEQLHLNRVLNQAGLLAFDGPPGVTARAQGQAQRLALKHLPGRVKELLIRRLPALASRLETQRRLGGIRFEATAAYSEGLSYAPSVRLNLRDRDLGGVLRPEDAALLLAFIRDRLLALRHPETSAALVSAVQVASEKQVALGGPELLLELGTSRGGLLTAMRASGPGPILTRLVGEALLGGKGRGPVGVHRREGVLVRSDPEPLPDTLPITAVHGLMMACLGMAEDGHQVEASPPESEAPPPSAYTDAQAARVRARLAAMGYG